MRLAIRTLLPIKLNAGWGSARNNDESQSIESLGSLALGLFPAKVLYSPYQWRRTMLNKMCLMVRSKMPTWYPEIEVVVIDTEKWEKHGRFIVSISPKGYRGIWLLGKIFEKFPFITGSCPEFHIKIKHKEIDKGYDSFHIRLERVSIPSGESSPVAMYPPWKDFVELDCKDIPITTAGAYRYDLTISVSVFDSNTPILACDVISQEQTFFTILTIGISLLSIIIAVIALVRS